MTNHDPSRTNHYEVGQIYRDFEKPQIVITQPSANQVVSGTIQVQVNASDNESVEHVEVLIDGVSVGTDNSYPFSVDWDTTKSASGSHSITAKAFDPTGNQSTSAAVVAIVPDRSPPSAPSNLIQTSKTAKTIMFGWDASTDNIGVAGYRVYRSGTLISTQTSRTFTDTGRDPNTSYEYSVKAYDAVNNESGSTNATFSTGPDTTPPNAPNGLRASNATATGQRISWNAPTDDVGVTGYEIYRNGSLIGTSAVTYFDDSHLQPLTAYAYTVKANDAAKNISANSSQLIAYTAADTTAPAAPTNGQVVDNTTSSQRIQWDAATDDVGVTGYRVYLGPTLIGTTSITYFDHSGLKSNALYTYTLRAFDGAGNVSPLSSEISGTTSREVKPPSVGSIRRGDINKDSIVNIFDLVLMLTNWNSIHSPADLNNSGLVDIFDLSILLYEYE
jgi:chitodextrinase